MSSIQLEKLLKVLTDKKIIGNTKINIDSICQNSKNAEKGSLFVAIPGYVNDGSKFIPEAVNNGSAAVVAEKDFKVSADITRIIVPSARPALAWLASCFFNFPSEKLKLIGITGTNGKTTTAYLTSSILNTAGEKFGSSTTIKVSTASKIIPSKRTTDNSLFIQNFLHQIVQEKGKYAVLEVSSHGLYLDRVTGCKFDLAVFTNLTHDHLDFHHDFSYYRSAKTKLFKMLKEDGSGIVNIDDPNAKYFIEPVKKGNILSYGLNEKADVIAENIKYSENGISCRVNTPEGHFNLTSRLSGSFNLYNLLASCAIGISLDLDLSCIKKGLEDVSSVPGRFEYIDCGQPFKIVVDYAHSPDSLEKVIKTAKGLTKGRVSVAFGATGDRDKGKRPSMGWVVAELSDSFIITNDDPYSEDPDLIIEQIENGVKKVLKRKNVQYKVIPDRKKAIDELIKNAEPDDFLIIAGKGHETKQIFKNNVIDFNDRKTVEEILKIKYHI